MENGFDYKKYLSLLAKHKRLFAVVALTIMTAAVATSYVLPKKFEASSTIFIEKNVISELIKGIAVTPSMEETIKVLRYAITSRTIIQKVVDDLDMNVRNNKDIDREKLIADIQKKITVTVKDNNLFIISYTDRNPRIASDFVNTLVRRYIEGNVSSKREESYGAINFLSDQLKTYKEKIDKSENELNRYKIEKGGVISIDEGKLFTEINTAQQKLYDTQLRRRQLEGLKPVTRRAGDPLQAKLSTLQKHLEELRSEYTDSYPEVIRTKSEIETLKEQIGGRKAGVESVVDPQELGKVEAELQALRINETSLERYIAANQALLSRIPAAKSGMEQLDLEVKNKKALYEQLMAKHGQSEVSKQMEVQDKTTNFRIVDPAILPVKPVSPNRVKIILMGIVAGLAGSFGILFALDQFDPAIRSIEALKSMGLSVMAVIPRIRVEEELQKERKRDRRLYFAASSYFALILLVLVTESLGFSLVERLFHVLKGS